MKAGHDFETEKYMQKQLEVKTLRKKKTEMTKKKELSEKECQKHSNELQQKIVNRKELEANAMKLTT